MVTTTQKSTLDVHTRKYNKRREEKRPKIKHIQNNRMAIKIYISIITLKVNGGSSDWLKKLKLTTPAIANANIK